jgi:glucose-6-phosphate 1-dehydrogenase
MRSEAMPSVDEPFSLIIFGASGDLTYRKLMPALWSLYAARTLPEPFAIVCTARTEMTDETFRARMREGVSEFARLKIPADHVWERFARNLFYVAGDPSSAALYEKLRATLAGIERDRSVANRHLRASTTTSSSASARPGWPSRRPAGPASSSRSRSAVTCPARRR